MCASTMQSYHMARTILLMNRPHESTARRSTLSDRLHSYRTIEKEVRYHSHEICGIALGRPEGSVRIHQVQPLFVAGQCLTESRERRIILDLLRGIESDLGLGNRLSRKATIKSGGVGMKSQSEVFKPRHLLFVYLIKTNNHLPKRMFYSISYGTNLGSFFSVSIPV